MFHRAKHELGGVTNPRSALLMHHRAAPFRRGNVNLRQRPKRNRLQQGRAGAVSGWGVPWGTARPVNPPSRQWFQHPVRRWHPDNRERHHNHYPDNDDRGGIRIRTDVPKESPTTLARGRADLYRLGGSEEGLLQTPSNLTRAAYTRLTVAVLFAFLFYRHEGSTSGLQPVRQADVGAGERQSAPSDLVFAPFE
jgi:hypothetical protein